MTQDTYYHTEQWFFNYVKAFYSEDAFIHKNVLLKEHHTQRVVAEAVSLCNALHLSDAQQLTAKAAALLHDIGRFEQFTQFKTFNDRFSLDHAELGIEIIEKNRLLDDAASSERSCIIDAVRYHNKWRYPQDLDAETTLVVKITRDADKIDIYRVVTENATANTFLKDADTSENSHHAYDENLVNAVLNDENIDSTFVKTRIDLTLLKLSWIYDINYAHSFRLIKERRFIEKLIEPLPHEPIFDQVCAHVISYVEEKTSEGLLGF